jgi:hypothetical protein
MRALIKYVNRDRSGADQYGAPLLTWSEWFEATRTTIRMFYKIFSSLYYSISLPIRVSYYPYYSPSLRWGESSDTNMIVVFTICDFLATLVFIYCLARGYKSGSRKAANAKIAPTETHSSRDSERKERNSQSPRKKDSNSQRVSSGGGGHEIVTQVTEDTEEETRAFK